MVNLVVPKYGYGAVLGKGYRNRGTGPDLSNGGGGLRKPLFKNIHINSE